MIKKEDCKCDCHDPRKNIAHGHPCCGVEEFGVDRFVATILLTDGPFCGMQLETDEARAGFGNGPMWYNPCLDVCDLTVKRLHVNLEPFLTKIRSAMNRVHAKHMQPKRITILKGEVQAHPGFNDHYKCPFCYPEMKRAIRPFGV
jgi:hypothetical protein